MKTVIVLGCYRSATSLVAQGLHHAGVHMGDDLLPAGRGNPWGHWEDRDFVRLSDEILAEAGGAWDDPPAEAAVEAAAEAFAERVRALLEAKRLLALSRGLAAWGWKDPRTVLTWPAFRPHLIDPVLVVVRRKFSAVAESLSRRDGAPADAAAALTRVYWRRLDAIVRWEEDRGGEPSRA